MILWIIISTEKISPTYIKHNNLVYDLIETFLKDFLILIIYLV
jgi:hypothetical protein